MVAGNEERPGVAVPDGESEHAAQVLNAILAILFKQVDDGFGVTVGGVAVAARDQLLAQGKMVVDLSVKDDVERAVFIGDWLMAAGHIDDAEAAHADASRAIGIETFVVRSAVGDDTAHFAEGGGVGALVAAELKNSSDPAH